MTAHHALLPHHAVLSATIPMTMFRPFDTIF
jgi:hypothetical protein